MQNLRNGMAVREWICDFGKTIDLLLDDLGDQMYHFIHLTLRLFSTPTVADVIDCLVYYTTYPKTTNFCCVIIEGANKMAGKGQITSERASSGRHATYRTQTS